MPVHGHRHRLHRARQPLGEPVRGELNGKLRDELFAREVFDTVMEARILFDDWGDVYNCHRSGKCGHSLSGENRPLRSGMIVASAGRGGQLISL